MNENSNSASRVLRILETAVKIPDATATKDAWAMVFSADGESEPRKLSAVSAALALTQSEVDLLRSRMDESDIPENLYEPYLRKVEAAISIHALGTPWNNFKPHISSDVLLALGYCAEILPKQEVGVSDDDLTALIDAVSELEAKLDSSTLPPAFVALIRRHVSFIRRAVTECGVIGAKALKDAVHRAAGELMEHRDEILENQDSEEVGQFARLCKELNRIADGALKVERVLQAGGRIMDMIFGPSTGG